MGQYLHRFGNLCFNVFVLSWALTIYMLHFSRGEFFVGQVTEGRSNLTAKEQGIPLRSLCGLFFSAVSIEALIPF